MKTVIILWNQTVFEPLSNKIACHNGKWIFSVTVGVILLLHSGARCHSALFSHEKFSDGVVTLASSVSSWPGPGLEVKFNQYYKQSDDGSERCEPMGCQCHCRCHQTSVMSAG